MNNKGKIYFIIHYDYYKIIKESEIVLLWELELHC